MIKMTVCQKYLIEPFKTNAGTQDLSLCALAAIDQKTVFFVLN